MLISDKERLEEIKEQVKYLQGDFLRDDLGWLIEQVERVEELEEQNTGLKQDLKDVLDRLEWVSDV